MNRKQRMIPLLSLLLLTAMTGCGVNELYYQSGYDDGYHVGYDAGCSAGKPEGGSTEVTVSGSFTVTVRELIPDYVSDGVTPRAAVVSFFQDGPFVLKLDETICGELETGEAYTFTVDGQVTLPVNELGDDGMVSPDALLLRHISVTDFHKADEEESGLENWRVYYTS